MSLQTAPVDTAPLETVLTEFVAGIAGAVPRVLSGLLFLALSYVIVTLILAVVRRLLERAYPDDRAVIVDVLMVVVGAFLWFGVALAFLKIVGLGDVAASLGTASGFIGLGIAFALKEMIADTVAGVYLILDSDFNVGDAVETASVSGTIVQVDFRKTRIVDDDGNLIVLANRDVEKKWTQEADPGRRREHQSTT